MLFKSTTVHYMLNYTLHSDFRSTSIEPLYSLSVSSMKKSKQHTFDLSLVLDALRDATRRQVLLQLAEKDFCCGSFEELGSKTRLTYHFARLREAGIISSTKNGRFRVLSLRRHELDAAFPGLLDAVLTGAKRESV